MAEINVREFEGNVKQIEVSDSEGVTAEIWVSSYKDMVHLNVYEGRLPKAALLIVIEHLKEIANAD